MLVAQTPPSAKTRMNMMPEDVDFKNGYLAFPANKTDEKGNNSTVEKSASTPPPPDDSDEQDPCILLVVKWGGELTSAGRQQAEELGRA